MIQITPQMRIWLAADRGGTTDLRAGRPSAPVAALECQSNPHPGRAAVVTAHACGLRLRAGPCRKSSTRPVLYYIPSTWLIPEP